MLDFLWLEISLPYTYWANQNTFPYRKLRQRKVGWCLCTKSVTIHYSCLYDVSGTGLPPISQSLLHHLSTAISLSPRDCWIHQCPVLCTVGLGPFPQVGRSPLCLPGRALEPPIFGSSRVSALFPLSLAPCPNIHWGLRCEWGRAEWVEGSSLNYTHLRLCTWGECIWAWIFLTWW